MDRLELASRFCVAGDLVQMGLQSRKFDSLLTENRWKKFRVGPNRRKWLGTTFDYATLSLGDHVFRIEVEAADGIVSVFVHAVTMVKLDSFEFGEDLDLSGATIQIDAGEIILENAVVHGAGCSNE